MHTILFVNHRDQACGVQQMGQKCYSKLALSKNYTYHYIDPAQGSEFDHWAGVLNPDVVVYNFYFSGATMPWLTRQKIDSNRHRFKQCTIFHEGNYDTMGFDLIFHQDPSFEGIQLNGIPVQVLTRPIPGYNARSDHQPSNQNRAPVIASFGFGLGGKGFARLAESVNREFDQATLKLNVPFARFGDADGNGARQWGADCRSLITKPGIEFILTHDLLPESQLLDWLADSDLIAFLYDQNGGRGISGTFDYALAVRKPIAITRSDQFRHIWQEESSCIYPDTSLKDILDQGTQNLEQFHEKWSDDAFVQSFERGFGLLGIHP